MLKNVRSFGDLLPAARVEGLIPNKAVTIIAVDVVAPDFAEITFRDDSGGTEQRVIGTDDLAALSIARSNLHGPTFTANAEEFRLAAEALRIKFAALYDPMVAVNSSDIDPLPHQIRAVYEHLLPKIGLRYLLADDPGAGKTIMAGLYLKEMMLRSNCERAVIVAPGGLVDQWQDELSTKFGLNFEILTRPMIDAAQGNNVFNEHSHLLVRMDQVARNDDLMEQMEGVTWDIAIVDEAHRMSARYASWEGSIKETRRFQLGRVLADRSHNFLLMTATPHAGKEEDFQLFLSLLDRDRFEGKYRPGVHRMNTDGVMRRMVKEDLLTFAGSQLFPERHAYTTTYELSPGERELYDRVTEYVRTEMGRAERLASAGDRKRGNTVGFALTVLQRRLASSPQAIYSSLQRRKSRLEKRLRDVETISEILQEPGSLDFSSPGWRPPQQLFELFDDFDDMSEEDRAQFEESVNEVVDLATAAQTVPELEAEIKRLDELVGLARQVRSREEDAKWVELRQILDREVLSSKHSEEGRKIIIFTEHRDTLDYLQNRIGDMLGDPEAVAVIHGGVGRQQRKEIREQFTHNPRLQVLLGTDAAGEGLNLQRAHLMVNYDLPWNPNRIEQRFGRIHRIGQTEVCHLWNLVAADTREGDVFTRLLQKIDQMSKAYNGKLFNVLGEGEAFKGKSLRELILEAIKYGDQPEVRARQREIIDSGVADGLDTLALEGALAPEISASLELDQVRLAMEKARERRLQPGFIAAFFAPAFKRLGGRIVRREKGRYQIKRVPTRVIKEARRANRHEPVAEAYERVTFDLNRIDIGNGPKAELLAPGSPFLSAVVDLTITDLADALQQGTIFINHQETGNAEPELSYIVEQKITSPSAGQTVSHHFDYLTLSEEGTISSSQVSPFWGFDVPTPEQAGAAREILANKNEWIHEDHETVIKSAAYRDGLLPRLEEVRARVEVESERTRALVEKRLLAEMNYWDSEHGRLVAQEADGNIGKIRASEAVNRARKLERRLRHRLSELEDAKRLTMAPALVRGVAAVVPARLLPSNQVESADRAKDTTEVDRRAVQAVLAAERALGRFPTEMEHSNPGYDIISRDSLGTTYYLEVKGRIAGADVFNISTGQVLFAHNQGDRHRLALVRVSSEGPEHDQVRYVGRAFDHFEPAETTQSLAERWKPYWERGLEPF